MYAFSHLFLQPLLLGKYYKCSEDTIINTKDRISFFFHWPPKRVVPMRGFKFIKSNPLFLKGRWGMRRLSFQGPSPERWALVTMTVPHKCGSNRRGEWERSRVEQTQASHRRQSIQHRYKAENFPIGLYVFFLFVYV